MRWLTLFALVLIFVPRARAQWQCDPPQPSFGPVSVTISPSGGGTARVTQHPGTGKYDVILCHTNLTSTVTFTVLADSSTAIRFVNVNSDAVVHTVVRIRGGPAPAPVGSVDAVTSFGTGRVVLAEMYVAGDSVNSSDISAFLISWLDSVNNNNLNADFNGDLAVNSTDISAFLTAWLTDVNNGC